MHWVSFDYSDTVNSMTRAGRYFLYVYLKISKPFLKFSFDSHCLTVLLFSHCCFVCLYIFKFVRVFFYLELNPIPETSNEESSPEDDPVHIPVIVKKMETLKAKKEDLEMSELARRFEKIDNNEQVSKTKQKKTFSFFLIIKSFV